MLKLTLRSVLQIFSVGIIGVAVLCGVLVWKLASGPIYLSFLTPYFVSSLNSSDGEVTFKVDDTLLEWNENQNNLQLNLQGVQAVASDGTLIVQVSNLSVELSGAALFDGKLAPKSIGIFGPIVNIVRTEFGDFEFGMIQSEKSIAKINARENKIVTDILYEIFVSKDQSRPLGYLKKVNILNADLNVDDKQLGARWRSPKTDVSLIRQQNNLFVSASLVLKPGNPGLHRPTPINLVGNYSLAAKDAKITDGFADLNPAEFYSLSHRLTFLKMFDFPIGGTVDVLVTEGGRIDKLEFDLKGGEGQVSYSDPIGLSADVTKTRLSGEYNNTLGLLKIDGLEVNFAKNKHVRIAKLYNGELSIKKLTLSGDYDSDFKKFVFRKRSFFSKDLTVEAIGKIQQIGRETIFEISSQASEIPIDYIPIVWPGGLAAGVKKSIAKTLSQGVITSAKANLNGKYSNARGVEIGSIISVLDYRDAAITLHSPALKVTKSKGRIRFDGKTVTADIMSGKSGNLLIRRGKILVTGTDSSDPLVNINLQINGQLETALRIAKELPLDLPVVDNPLSGGVSGSIHSILNFSFRLKEGSDLDGLKFSADAYMKNARFPRAIMNMDLTSANLRLKVNNEQIKVTGTGGIAG